MATEDEVRNPKHRGGPSLEPGRVLAGRYKVTGFIGAGGMGAVYAAKHVRTGRELALKVLLPEFASREDLMLRFGAEARAAGSLNHPGIVEVVDLDSEGELHFIVMERLEGEELQSRIQRDHPLDPAWVARVGADIADAIGCAHANNPKIIHRDLKPQNVFLARKGRERDVVKILDFGIAKLVEAETLERSVTRSGEIYGTPLYMSPEQLRSSKDVDERADIYAIGVILYHALTGVTPFRGESFSDLVVAISTEEFPPLRSIRSDVPPALAAVVERAMARNKQSRFGTAAQLRDALLRFAGGRAALPDSFAETQAADHTTEKIPPTQPAGSSRRWLIGGALAAGVVAVAGVWLGRGSTTPSPSPAPPVSGAVAPPPAVPTPPKATVAADAAPPPVAAPEPPPRPRPEPKPRKPKPGRDELPALRPR